MIAGLLLITGTILGLYITYVYRQEVKSKQEKIKTQNERIEILSARNMELGQKIEQISIENRQIAKDNIRISKSLEQLSKKIDKVVKKNQKIVSGNKLISDQNLEISNELKYYMTGGNSYPICYFRPKTVYYKTSEEEAKKQHNYISLYIKVKGAYPLDLYEISVAELEVVNDVKRRLEILRFPSGTSMIKVGEAIHAERLNNTIMKRGKFEGSSETHLGDIRVWNPLQADLVEFTINLRGRNGQYIYEETVLRPGSKQWISIKREGFIVVDGLKKPIHSWEKKEEKG